MEIKVAGLGGPPAGRRCNRGGPAGYPRIHGDSLYHDEALSRARHPETAAGKMPGFDFQS